MKTKCCILFLLVAFSSVQPKAQTTKDKWRLAHVVKNMKMDKPSAEKLTPLFFAYLKELHEAKDIYDIIKKKYKKEIDNHQLTEAQAHELLHAHWRSEAQEVRVKLKYTTEFRQVLSEPEIFFLFRLANDKAPSRLKSEE